MRKTVVSGVWTWSRWQPDRDLDFNGFFVEGADGNLVIDPVEPDEATLAALRERGVAAVVVTNRDHERATAAVVAATGAQVIASELDAPLLVQRVDRTVNPGDVVHGWTVIGLDGFKTAGEIALYDRARNTAIVGDALWGTPAGALTLMPDAKLADPVLATLSARKLRALRLDHLLVGDGACVFGNAHAAIGAMIDARPGVLANRVNLHELDYVPYVAPTPFGSLDAEVGLLIGAEKLGYLALKLAPGQAVCPYHWHTAEEELFVVIAGTPALRTPKGTFALRAGDVIAFPTGPGGAHRLQNDSAEEAHVLLIANNEEASDSCFYPDSRKHVVGGTRVLARDEPALDYFDGETAPEPSANVR
jgi:uncharacterized cupin superfamily protein/glyoxylase-like metal-dependent hydrolase (beta-lactamase superfamily II)